LNDSISKCRNKDTGEIEIIKLEIKIEI